MDQYASDDHLTINNHALRVVDPLSSKDLVVVVDFHRLHYQVGPSAYTNDVIETGDNEDPEVKTS